MVRDNLRRTVVQSQKQICAAETQNQSHQPEEPEAPEQAQCPEKVNSESQEPTEGQLDLLLWNRPNLEEDQEDWQQVSAKFSPFKA